MRKLLLGLGIIAALSGCGSNPTPVVADDIKVQIKEYYQSKAEPESVDAKWKTKYNFVIGVNKGTVYPDLYAEKTCRTIKDKFDVVTFLITIYDIKKITDTNEWEKLAEYECVVQ